MRNNTLVPDDSMWNGRENPQNPYILILYFCILFAHLKKTVVVKSEPSTSINFLNIKCRIGQIHAFRDFLRYIAFRVFILRR
jgi:hypothetical protein